MQTLGIANGACYLVGRALSRLTGGRTRIVRYRFVAQPVPRQTQPLPAGSTLIQEIDATHPMVSLFPRPPAVIRRRFELGHRCFLATSKGVFAGFLWLAHQAYEEDEVRSRFILTTPGQCAWDFDVYVEPRFRLGRMFSRLWQAANHALRSEGFEWSLSRISTFNAESLAAHHRLGAQSLGSATYLCIGPLQLSLVPTAPYFHVSLTPASRPRIKLCAPDDSSSRQGTKSH